MKRSGQALEARLVIERLFDETSDALVAVCGDCNADLQEVPMKILRGDRDHTTDARMAERRIAPARSYSLIHGGKMLMLDHILDSKHLLERLAWVDLKNREIQDEVEILDTDPTPRHASLVAQFDMTADRFRR